MLSDFELSQRFYAAVGIVSELGHAAERFFGDKTKLEVSMKGFQDWLTIADGAIETLFRKRLAETFPDDAVMGEELGAGGSASGRLWIIDPIDGTANFARGDRQWCVSVGFVADGVPEIGVIHCPALEETYLGRRNHGATMNGAPIRVSGVTDIRRSSVEFGWSPRLPTEQYLNGVGRLYALGATVKRSASGALGLAHVANGRTDGYAELHINSWDAAAGIVIAREAGAWVNGFATGDWVRTGNPLLAVTPGLKDAVLEASGVGGARPGVDVIAALR